MSWKSHACKVTGAVGPVYYYIPFAFEMSSRFPKQGKAERDRKQRVAMLQRRVRRQVPECAQCDGVFCRSARKQNPMCCLIRVLWGEPLFWRRAGRWGAPPISLEPGSGSLSGPFASLTSQVPFCAIGQRQQLRNFRLLSHQGCHMKACAVGGQGPAAPVEERFFRQLDWVCSWGTWAEESRQVTGLSVLLDGSLPQLRRVRPMARPDKACWATRLGGPSPGTDS